MQISSTHLPAGGPAVPSGAAFRSLSSPAASFTKSQPDDFSDSLRKLARMTGNQKMLDKLEEARKKSAERLSRNIPKVDEQVRQQIGAYLQGGAPVPDGFDAQHQGFLDSFASLHRRGVQFVDYAMKPMEPVEAFTRLVTRPDERDFSQQVFYKAYETRTMDIMGTPQQMTGITTATVRAEYLAPLDYFVEKAKDGRVLVGPAGERYDVASEFSKEHGDDYASFEPRVPYNGELLTEAEWQQREHDRRRDEVERLAGRSREGAPEVKDLGDEIVIGGVVLSKRGG